jgi:hypothetical protein
MGVLINYIMRSFVKLPKYNCGCKIKGDKMDVNCGMYVVGTKCSCVLVGNPKRNEKDLENLEVDWRTKLNVLKK